MSKTCSALDHVRVGWSDVGGAYKLETAGKDGRGEDVSQRQTLTDKEGVQAQVALNDTDDLEGGSLGSVDVLLVVCVTADQRAEPAAEVREDLSVAERHPPQDRGVVLLGLSEESGLLVLGSD